jgi:hypothetical protein
MWRNIYNNRFKYNQLIQFGSAYELNLNQDNALIDFNNVLKEFPLTSYGLAKNLIARNCVETENFYNLRLFGNFHFTEKDTRFFKTLSRSSVFTINQDRYFDYVNLEDVLTITKFVINEKPLARDINVVYNKKLLLSEQVELFCSVNKIHPQIVINDKGYELTGRSDLIDSFNLEFEGLEKGFIKYL